MAAPLFSQLKQTLAVLSFQRLLYLVATAALSAASFYTTFMGMVQYVVWPIALGAAIGIQVALFFLALRIAQMVRPLLDDLALIIAYLLCFLISGAFSFFGLYDFVESCEGYANRAEKELQVAWTQAYDSLTRADIQTSRGQVDKILTAKGMTDWQDAFRDMSIALAAYVSIVEPVVTERRLHAAEETTQSARRTLEESVRAQSEARQKLSVAKNHVEASELALSERRVQRTNLQEEGRRVREQLGGSGNTPGARDQVLQLREQELKAQKAFAIEVGSGGTKVDPKVDPKAERRINPDTGEVYYVTTQGLGPAARALRDRAEAASKQREQAEAQVKFLERTLADVDARSAELSTAIEKLTSDASVERRRIAQLELDEQRATAEIAQLQPRLNAPAEAVPMLPTNLTDQEKVAFVGFNELSSLASQVRTMRSQVERLQDNAKSASSLSTDRLSLVTEVVERGTAVCQQVSESFRRVEGLLLEAARSAPLRITTASPGVGGPAQRCASGVSDLARQREWLDRVTRYAGLCDPGKIFSAEEKLREAAQAARPPTIERKDGQCPTDLEGGSFYNRHGLLRARLTQCVLDSPSQNGEQRAQIRDSILASLGRFAPDTKFQQRAYTALLGNDTNAWFAAVVAASLDGVVLLLALVYMSLYVRAPIRDFRRIVRDADFRALVSQALQYEVNRTSSWFTQNMPLSNYYVRVSNWGQTPEDLKSKILFDKFGDFLISAEAKRLAIRDTLGEKLFFSEALFEYIFLVRSDRYSSQQATGTS